MLVVSPFSGRSGSFYVALGHVSATAPPACCNVQHTQFAARHRLEPGLISSSWEIRPHQYARHLWLRSYLRRDGTPGAAHASPRWQHAALLNGSMLPSLCAAWTHQAAHASEGSQASLQTLAPLLTLVEHRLHSP